MGDGQSFSGFPRRVLRGEAKNQRGVLEQYSEGLEPEIGYVDDPKEKELNGNIGYRRKDNGDGLKSEKGGGMCLNESRVSLQMIRRKG